MINNIVKINGIDMNVYSLNTVIVGSGAAGLNAADSLYSLGQKDIAIITEGINMGTSRNTGSDKQTYYKLTLEGGIPDSVIEMAKTLYYGGSMHGDIALVEAALSAKAFYKLVDIGVPFPHNQYGEYVGYKTDHDPRKRATSAGPLTSKFMTERLEEQVKNKGIRIFDGYQVIGILTRTEEASAEINCTGLIALDLNNLQQANRGFTLFNCTNLIYATGGPAGMYLKSVYPESQIGALGIAFEAGAKGINLTESQYGIASTEFRWNLSGTYQQVIPRYISVNADGSDEKEFLNDYFDEPKKMLSAIFLKGYQWPFDPRKIFNYGSSLIDILVYNETQIKGRKVYLDFTRNSSWGSIDGELDFSLLSEEAFEYLEKSGALFGAPIQRLAKMNQPAIDLYRSNGIDLTKEYLEIDVCVQHNNGGLLGNIWWESNVKHLFPVGEVNGTFGVYRPGGTALNSTQVGSFRAAQCISTKYYESPMHIDKFVKYVSNQVKEKVKQAEEFLSNKSDKANIIDLRKKMQLRMTKSGAHIRNFNNVIKAIDECVKELKNITKITTLNSVYNLPQAFINRDILITQLVYLNAIKEYIQKGGKSRGSYLVVEDDMLLSGDKIDSLFKCTLEDGEFFDKVCEVGLYIKDNELACIFEWKKTRPIPHEDNWFENVWSNYRNGNIVQEIP